MKILKSTTALIVLIHVSACPGADIPNQLIDSSEHLRMVNQSLQQREKTRLTEKQFQEAMATGECTLLDARSAANFKLRHIKGAVNLPFTEFTADSLAKVIPNKGSKILIYCNNNFMGSPNAFASKAPAAALNLSTQASLRAYGYHHIFELGPAIHIQKTLLKFEGTEVGP